MIVFSPSLFLYLNSTFKIKTSERYRQIKWIPIPLSTNIIDWMMISFRVTFLFSLLFFSAYVCFYWRFSQICSPQNKVKVHLLCVILTRIFPELNRQEFAYFPIRGTEYEYEIYCLYPIKGCAGLRSVHKK